MSSTIRVEEQICNTRDNGPRYFRGEQNPKVWSGSSQGERQVVCCILYLTRCEATGTAHHSGFKEALLVEHLLYEAEGLGSIPSFYKKQSLFRWRVKEA